jgi:hypothetical protein
MSAQMEHKILTENTPEGICIKQILRIENNYVTKKLHKWKDFKHTQLIITVQQKPAKFN